MSKSFAICFYMDPEAPQSLSPGTPGGGSYLLGNYQWVSTKDPNPTFKSSWAGESDNPVLKPSVADSLSFWAVGPYDENTDFIIEWDNLGGSSGPDSPIGGSSQTVLRGADGPVPRDIIPPGFKNDNWPGRAWFFGSTPIIYGTDSERYSFTVEAKPGEENSRFRKARFFLDPEMETDPDE